MNEKKKILTRSTSAPDLGRENLGINRFEYSGTKGHRLDPTFLAQFYNEAEQGKNNEIAIQEMKNEFNHDNNRSPAKQGQSASQDPSFTITSTPLKKMKILKKPYFSPLSKANSISNIHDLERLNELKKNRREKSSLVGTIR